MLALKYARAIGALVFYILCALNWSEPSHAQVVTQYDYNSVGRVCRARLSNGATVNYLYDKNGNRREVSQALAGGVSTSGACVQVIGSPASSSNPRPRTNRDPFVVTSQTVRICAAVDQNIDPETGIPASTSPCGGTINALRWWFDWDLNQLTVVSAAFVTGSGSISVQADGAYLDVVPSTNIADDSPGQIIYTVSDGHGGTATAYINVIFYRSVS